MTRELNKSKIEFTDIDGTTLAVGDTVIEVTPPHRVVIIETLPTADNTIIECTIDGLYNALPTSIIRKHCRKKELEQLKFDGDPASEKEIG